MHRPTAKPAKLTGLALIALVAGTMLVGQATLRSGPASNGLGHVSSPNKAALAGQALANLDRLPISFEPNVGQSAQQVRYLARSSNFTLYLTAEEAVISLSPRSTARKPLTETRGAAPGSASAVSAAPSSHAAVLRYTLKGANPQAAISAGEKLAGISNYFTGNDPANWHANVPNFRSVRYSGVYPGVDMVWHGTGGQIEYDFEVAPGADPAQVRLGVSGADSIVVQGDELVLHTAAGDLRQAAPRIYQDGPGGRMEVAGKYLLSANNEISFEVAAYDKSRTLVIDPVLSYSTYLGGSGYDDGRGIAVDAQGSAYVTGLTQSTNFPTQSPTQGTNAGGFDAFVTKFSADGTSLVYSTYLGGSGDEGDIYLDGDNAIAVDAQGSAYVAGRTNSTDYPTQNAYQSQNAGGAYDAYLTKLSPSGNGLVFSTYLGGTYNDYATGVAVDSAGAAYVAGVTYSLDFPTANPFQATKSGFEDAFVTKFTPAGDALVYSTYLGGGADAAAAEVAVDSQGSAYVLGFTGSSDFPTQNAFQATYGGNTDAFLTKFSPAGNTLAYSTYLGGSQTEFAFGVAVDSQNRAYVTGYTQSSDFPTHNAFQPAIAGGYDIFVTRFSPTGNTVDYSTFLGGRYWDFGFSIAASSQGEAYVTGYSESDNFPTANPIQSTRQGPDDIVIARFSPSGDSLVYSTYLGGNGSDYGLGIAVDSAGSAYLTGNTSSITFPTHNPFQGTFGGGNLDAFAVKIVDQPAATPTATATAQPSSTPTATATATPQPGTPTATATACAINFSDVHPSDYFYTPVQYLYCNGVISGYADGTFRPYNDTTRAQLSKIVVLADGWPIDTTGGPHFTDVPTDHPFYAYIETAYAHSIISGYADNTFRPYNNVTRGQLSKIVVLAQNWPITPPSEPTFRDVPVGDPFYGYVETAYTHSIISGYSCGTGCLEFRPGNNATRGQISKIVYLAITAPSAAR